MESKTKTRSSKQMTKKQAYFNKFVKNLGGKLCEWSCNEESGIGFAFAMDTLYNINLKMMVPTLQIGRDYFTINTSNINPVKIDGGYSFNCSLHEKRVKCNESELNEIYSVVGKNTKVIIKIIKVD